jgi:hypothetical protein
VNGRFAGVPSSTLGYDKLFGVVSERSNGGTMSDLETSTAEFLARVDRHSPDELKRVRAVLDDLLRWSAEHAWGVSFSGRGPLGPIRFCVDGIVTPLWVVTPRSVDGARLTLLTAAHPRFPEDLRAEVRQVCAQIDGRVPTPDEVPVVGCGKLRWPPNRDAILSLMTRALNRVHGKTAVAEPATV